MRNKTILVLACLFIIKLTAYSNEILYKNTEDISPVKIIEQTSNSVTLSIKSSNIYLKEEEVNKTIYKLISMKKFGRLNKTGFPNLPYRGFKIATDNNPNISLEILEQETELIEDILVYPADEPAYAVVGKNQGDLFRKDEKAYATNEFYPKNPIEIINTQDFHGVPITTLGIIPMKHNPVTKELIIYKKLVIKVTFPKNRSTITLSNNSLKTIKNIIVNPDAISSSRSRGLSDFEDDILIITTNSYIAAAETLSTWHKMKGYDVKIVSKSTWTSYQVDTEVKAFYNNASVKPGYLLIIGDADDVPPEAAPSIWTWDGSMQHATDNYYVCMGSNDDYTAEMARGRISVSSASEAMTIVNKILKYEKMPPTKDSFYTNALSCGYFQGYGDYNENGDNVADRRFVQTVEEILNYLDTNYNINSDRIYVTKDDVDPMKWNDGSYSFGEPVPDHLRRPGFAWDGDNIDIANGINDGRFLVYHYDHGYEQGWGDPAFSSANVNGLLNNEDMLPLIYSIDCLVGRFDDNGDCFAEIVTKKSDGGAIGIVAASTLSSSGNNEALLDGMIDATWPSPGLILSTPTWKDPTVITHEPLYNFGDIMNQGFIRMSETWPYNNSYHCTMYHLFGDPTTPLWTEVPKQISKNSENVLPINASTYSINNLNVNSGVATLYDAENDTVIGKAEISGSSVDIPISCSPQSKGDSITLTIVSHNYIPSIEKIGVSDPVDISAIAKYKMNTEMLFKGNNIILNIPLNVSASINIFDLKGRNVYQWNRNNNNESEKVSIDLSNENFPNGLYIIKGNIGNKNMEYKFNILK